MDFEFVTRYLARIFVREKRNPPVLMRLAADFAEQAELSDWQPTMVDDLDLATAQFTQGCQLVSPDQCWTVKVTGESFDIQATQGYNLNTRSFLEIPTFTEYLERVQRYFEIGMRLFGVAPHRIAIVQGGVLKEPAEGAASFDAVCQRLLNLPDMGDAPFEWNWRSAWKVDREFGGLSEPTNSIVSIRLAEVKHAEPLGNRLVVELDINTEPLNTEPRFSAEQVAAFVSESRGWHDQLERIVVQHAGIES